MNLPHSAASLLPLIARLADSPVLVIGDIMLDHFVFGSVSRISPEAPVPVVRVTQERHELGGAGNVARNIRSLGGKVHLLSLVGEDADGQLLGDLLEQEGIGAQLLRIPNRPTTKKTRIIAHHQQVVRVDSETQDPMPEGPSEQLLSHLRELLPHFPAVIVSDYGKGMITKAVLDCLRSHRSKSSHPCHVLVDPKVSNFTLYHGVDLLTPNTLEAEQAVNLTAGDTSLGLAKVGHAIFKMLHCSHLLITLGSRGMAFFDTPGRILHIPTVARNVYDVTGAGDTVIAVIALGLSAGLAMFDACLLANFAAGHVVGQVGTACINAQQLAAIVQEEPFPEISYILQED